MGSSIAGRSKKPVTDQVVIVTHAAQLDRMERFIWVIAHFLRTASAADRKDLLDKQHLHGDRDDASLATATPEQLAQIYEERLDATLTGAARWVHYTRAENKAHGQPHVAHKNQTPGASRPLEGILNHMQHPYDPPPKTLEAAEVNRVRCEEARKAPDWDLITAEYAVKGWTYQLEVTQKELAERLDPRDRAKAERRLAMAEEQLQAAEERKRVRAEHGVAPVGFSLAQLGFSLAQLQQMDKRMYARAIKRVRLITLLCRDGADGHASGSAQGRHGGVRGLAVGQLHGERSAGRSARPGEHPARAEDALSPPGRQDAPDVVEVHRQVPDAV